jgi:hypothetical protein
MLAVGVEGNTLPDVDREVYRRLGVKRLTLGTKRKGGAIWFKGEESSDRAVSIDISHGAVSLRCQTLTCSQA